MKQAELDNLKANLPMAHQNYFTENNSDWIKNFCNDVQPFEEFQEVLEFKLVNLQDCNGDESKVDFENCKILYQNLKFLTEVQASDELFWAGLTHSEFYNFVRERYNYNPNEIKKDAVISIQRNFFFYNGVKVGNITNALAKCWWMGRLLYDETNINPFWKLDSMGETAFYSKTFEILKRSFSSNPNILNGIVKFFEKYPNLKREDWKAALRHLNKIGGNVILDYLNEDEIAKILIDYAEKISDTQKNNSKIVKKVVAPKIVDIQVKYRDEVWAICLKGNKLKIFNVENLEIFKALGNKRVGDTFEFDSKNYRIQKIYRGNVNGGNNL